MRRRKARTDWDARNKDARNKRGLAWEEVVRPVPDGTAAHVRLDRKAANASLLAVLGVRRDGRKVLFWALLASGQVTM